jgi:hypothetical protein
MTRLVLLFLALVIGTNAQRKAKQPVVDTGLVELEQIGATLAKAVENQDWATVLNYEPPEWRAGHLQELRDTKSDFYCFLVDANCNPNWKGRTSIYRMLAGAHSMALTVVASGPSPAQAATIFFYDRSLYSATSVRSTQFLCKEDGWKKVAYWSFGRVDGKWVAQAPAFEYATDSICPLE